MKQLIKIGTPSCRPCKELTNFLEGLNVDYVDINAEVNPEIPSQYGVMGTPTTILLDNGVEVSRVVGFKPADIMLLVEKINSN